MRRSEDDPAIGDGHSHTHQREQEDGQRERRSPSIEPSRNRHGDLSKGCQSRYGVLSGGAASPEMLRSKTTESGLSSGLPVGVTTTLTRRSLALILVIVPHRIRGSCAVVTVSQVVPAASAVNGMAS